MSQCRPVINRSPLFKGLDIRIPIIIYFKGRVFINPGSTFLPSWQSKPAKRCMISEQYKKLQAVHTSCHGDALEKTTVLGLGLGLLMRRRASTAAPDTWPALCFSVILVLRGSADAARRALSRKCPDVGLLHCEACLASLTVACWRHLHSLHSTDLLVGKCVSSSMDVRGTSTPDCGLH